MFDGGLDSFSSAHLIRSWRRRVLVRSLKISRKREFGGREWRIENRPPADRHGTLRMRIVVELRHGGPDDVAGQVVVERHGRQER